MVAFSNAILQSTKNKHRQDSNIWFYIFSSVIERFVSVFLSEMLSPPTRLHASLYLRLQLFERFQSCFFLLSIIEILLN